MASKKCLALGLQLVSIESEEKNEELASFLGNLQLSYIL
jgi:hypothetical protein